ncbi:MAG: DUF192 domain-containing protein [Acidimicrobiales bacterium]|nr:DUF192 domain-containing protein [Acidimicrobiales bacterium]
MTLDERALRRLLWVAVALVALGVWFFVLRGADQPDDPVLGAPSTPAGYIPPGDPDRVPIDGFSEVAIAVEPADGEGLLAWCLLAAMDAAERSRGLMEVTDLQGYSGMAFVYGEEQANGFYMRNTPMPLSIAWIDRSGKVVSTADMAPCENRDDCPTYPPAGPYRLAVEVPQGQLDDLGITPGATVTVAGDCAPRPT